MTLWMALFLVPGQVVDSDDFPRAMQIKAAAATVRVVNRTERLEGSGVIIGRKDNAFYVLTAAHFLERAGKLEVSTFTTDSYPDPAKVYDRTEVVARTKDVRDLALIRVSTKDRPAALLQLCPADRVPKKGNFRALSVGCGVARAPVCIVETVVGAKSIRRKTGPGTGLFWEVKAEQSPGRSGGPLLDLRGDVIGVASGTSNGKGYYCHATEVRRWLKAGRFDFLLPDEGKERGK